MSDQRCGCCEGVEKRTPLPTFNRPGLSALSYRIGTHATFFETMKACLSVLAPTADAEDGDADKTAIHPLRGLTTRSADDPAIALLDAWATVADVLTFYQERIANEGYLPTATERRSILELARLVGYEPRPGVSSSVYLAFTLEDGYEIEIPAGTRSRSVPDPGDLPQAFETVEPIEARTEWNAISPRLSRPQYLTGGSFEGRREVFLKGVLTNLKANDALLLLCPSSDGGRVFESPFAYRVDSLETDAEREHTLVAYRGFRTGAAVPLAPVVSTPPPSGSAPEADRPALARLGTLVDTLKRPPSRPPANRFQLERSIGETYGASAELGPQLLVHLNPALRDTLYTAYAKAPAALAPAVAPCAAAALRVKASPFGHNAPLDLVYNDDNALVGRREWGLMELGRTATVHLTSTAGESVVQPFGDTFILSDGDFPALNIAVSVTDESGAAHQIDRDLASLDHLTPPDQQNHVFQTTLRLSDPGSTPVVIRASYAGPFDDDSNLEEIRVTVGQTGRETSVAIVQSRSLQTQQALGVRIDRDALRTIGPGQETTETVGNRTVAVSLNGGLRITHRTPALRTPEQLRTLTLDAAYEEIQPGGWVIVDRADEAVERIGRVVSVRTLSRADYGISGKVTQLVLDRPWLTGSETSLAAVRGATVFAGSESLELAEAVIADDVAGDTLELDGLYDGLQAGRWLVVSGERADLPGNDGKPVEGVQSGELVMLAGVTHDVRRVDDAQGQSIELPGDTLHTTLTLEEPLAYAYKRNTVKINANVAKATHGETQEEVLGGGDGSKAMQTFTLKKPPLTYVADPNPKGVKSTLEVRVNKVRWREADSLVWLGGTDRGFITQTDNEGNTSVIFGDGEHGARLPTGADNVRSVYRSGIGKIGNVAAGQISQLATKPLGVKEVVNPIGASGGADKETRDQARRNAPLAVTSLDRIVSIQDYADFARTFAGIGKASAIRLSDGRRRVVHLTIAGADDIPIDPYSDLYNNLSLALRDHGDPLQPVQIDLREAMLLLVGAKVRVLPDYQWESVEPDVRAALLEAFDFDRRELGRDVVQSEVVSVIQGVPGVDYVDVDLLDSISETEAADVRQLAAKLELLAGTAPPVGNGPKVEQPRSRIAVEMARIVPGATDPDARIRPAQIAYLSPDVPDTLILTEIEP